MKLRIPHAFIFLFWIIILCSLLTYIVPSGSFDREKLTYGKMEQTVVVPGSYKVIPKHLSASGVLLEDRVEGYATPISLQGLLMAVPKGLAQSAVLVFFVFIIGAVFFVVFETGSVQALLFYLIEKFREKPTILLFLVYLLISIGSSFAGIVVEIIAILPVLMILARQMGYDPLFGLALGSIPMYVGWSTAITNPFTVQIAQQLAELPIGSGMLLRVVLFVIGILIGFTYVMKYGDRVKKNKGLTSFDDSRYAHLGSQDSNNIAKESLKKRHLLILGTVAICYAGIIAAVQTMGWGLIEMSGGFVGIAILVIFISGMSGDESMAAFIKGLESMIVPALIVGVARGVSVVMQEGMIMDTILHHTSSTLAAAPKTVAGIGMLIFQSFLNFFIPSASGQALVSMPLMTPLADLLGLTRQTAVLAYILGDGLSNMIIPTNGILMAMIGLSRISFGKWFRFAFPLFVIMMVVGVVFMTIAIMTNYQ